MAKTYSYALERGGPKRLAIVKHWFWRNTEVKLDGQLLGLVRTHRTLKRGQSFTLPDGRALVVSLESQLTVAGVALTLDGRPVPGATNDPRMTIRAAGKLLWVLAGLNLLVGAALASASGGIRTVGFGVAAFGAVLAGLGFAVFFRHSRLALAAAIVLQVVLGLSVVVQAGGHDPPVGSLVWQGLIVLVLVRAYQAVERARKLELDETIDRAFR